MAEMLPMVSVVVPFHNRFSLLECCLVSLVRQTYSRYEIILVDDGSDDNPDMLFPNSAVSIRVIRQSNGGPASARNTGLKASTADAVAFIDSDCVADNGWLESLVAALLMSGADGVGGPILEFDARSWISHYLTTVRFFRHRVRQGVVDYLLTSNVIFWRKPLSAVNGFREGVWSEDADLSFRLKQGGYILAISDQGTVTHYGSPRTVPAFARLLYRYGYGNAILSRRWQNGRIPRYELGRRAGALIVSPWLALRQVRLVGAWKAITFWPLIVIEHGAFAVGYMTGLIRRGMQ